MALVTGKPLADFKSLALATTKKTSKGGANVAPEELRSLKNLFDKLSSSDQREVKRFLRSQDANLASTVHSLQAQQSSLFRMGR